MALHAAITGPPPPAVCMIRRTVCSSVVPSAVHGSGVDETRVGFGTPTLDRDDPAARCRCGCPGAMTRVRSCYPATMTAARITPPRIAGPPLPPRVLSVADRDGTAVTVSQNARAPCAIAGAGRTIDLGAARHPNDCASRALTSPNAKDSPRRITVRTAIRLARPEKS